MSLAILILGIVNGEPTGEFFRGWTQIMLQGGAFALLTYIVVRLGPQLMASTAAEREARDKKFTDAVESLENKFDRRTALLVTSIDTQTVKLVNEMEKQTRDMAQILARMQAARDKES